MNNKQKTMDDLLTEKIREIVRSEMKAFMADALQDLQTELVKAIEENLQTELITALKETLQTAQKPENQPENHDEHQETETPHDPEPETEKKEDHKSVSSYDYSSDYKSYEERVLDDIWRDPYP